MARRRKQERVSCTDQDLWDEWNERVFASLGEDREAVWLRYFAGRIEAELESLLSLSELEEEHHTALAVRQLLEPAVGFDAILAVAGGREVGETYTPTHGRSLWIKNQEHS